MPVPQENSSLVEQASCLFLNKSLRMVPEFGLKGLTIKRCAVKSGGLGSRERVRFRRCTIRQQRRSPLAANICLICRFEC